MEIQVSKSKTKLENEQSVILVADVITHGINGNERQQKSINYAMLSPEEKSTVDNFRKLIDLLL